MPDQQQQDVITRTIASGLAPSQYPSYESVDYQLMTPGIIKMNDVYDGIDVLQKKSKTYLPQFPAEEDQTYKDRVAASTLFEALKETESGMRGMVFRKDPVVNSDVDALIQTHLENVNLSGDHLAVFANDVMKWGNIDGLCHVLVDHLPELPDGATYHDYKLAQRRPYWTIRRAGDVINWRIRNTNGIESLAQVTIREFQLVENGDFGERIRIRYRVLKPGEYQIWEAEEIDKETGAIVTSKTDKPAFRLVAEGKTTLPYIPLFTYYTGKERLMFAKPPLAGIRDQNLLHFRMQSDFFNTIHWANVPILAAVNRSREENKQMVIGPMLIDLDKDGSLGYVEHTGAALGQTSTEIDKIEARMAKMGLALISPDREVQQTATESQINVAAQSSKLFNWARSLEDMLELCAKAHGDYINKQLPQRKLNREGGSIEVNKEFVETIMDTAEMAQYDAMVEKHHLSLKTMWAMLKAGKRLPANFDEKQERIEIANDLELLPAVDVGLPAEPAAEPIAA
jgi:hypothetical protein